MRWNATTRGGGDSNAKADRLYGELLQAFKSRQNRAVKFDVSELAAFLQDYMDKEFDTECEDGSPDQAAEEICQVFMEVSTGNFASAQSKIQRATAVKNNPAGMAAPDQEGDRLYDDAQMGEEERRRRRELFADQGAGAGAGAQAGTGAGGSSPSFGSSQ